MAINNLATVQQNNVLRTEYWDKRLLGMIVLESKNFVFTHLGMPKSIPYNQGTKTFSMRRYNSLPVGDHTLTEGVAPTALKVEAQKVQGAITQYGAYIEETDVVGDIHMDDIKNVYQPELSRHAAEVRERAILASFTDASEFYVNARADADAVVAGDVLTLKDARLVALKMKNYRRKGHRKFNGKPVLVVHNNVMQDLLDDDALENKLLVPGNDNTPIKNGTLERYLAYGMYFVETEIADVTPNTGTINVYTSYLLGRDPYVCLELGKKNVKFYNTGFNASKSDPLGQKAQLGYKFWFGAKVVDPMAITRVYSASGFDTAYVTAAQIAADNLAKSASQA